MSYPVGLLDEMTRTLDDEARAQKRAEMKARAHGRRRR